jgi:predicted aspartyl protease
VNGWHINGGLSGDEWVRIIALLMVLTLVLGRIVNQRSAISRTAWLALVWMALIWAGIIAAAALAFQHFRPGGM